MSADSRSTIMAVRRGDGSYLIAVDAVDIGNGQFACDPMAWRDARRFIEPEAYAHLARTTFTDWCRRNGYPEEVTG